VRRRWEVRALPRLLLLAATRLALLLAALPLVSPADATLLRAVLRVSAGAHACVFHAVECIS